VGIENANLSGRNQRSVEKSPEPAPGNKPVILLGRERVFPERGTIPPNQEVEKRRRTSHILPMHIGYVRWGGTP